MRYPELKTEADVKRFKRAVFWRHFVRNMLRDPIFWIAIVAIAYGITVARLNW